VRRVLAETAGRVEAVLARLGRDPAGYGLVHADLCLENILDHHGQARPIDFDDASWGPYALDLAIAAEDIPGELHPVLLRGYHGEVEAAGGQQRGLVLVIAGRQRVHRLTMEIYTEVPSAVTRDALKRLGSWLDT
jgi:Ser/Thr protein kinase RdoA (MazF antagonist)